VFFPQIHRPGELGESDFTAMSNLDITIEGIHFEHIIYHYVLPKFCTKPAMCQPFRAKNVLHHPQHLVL